MHIENGILIWVAFLVLIGLAAALWPRDEVAEFREECRKQCMDFAETQAALAIRIAFVRLRRIASELCLEKGGAITKDDFAEIVNQEAQGLHLIHGLETAKSFIAWANSCPDTEILYPDAVDVHMRWLRARIAANKIEIDPVVARQAEQDLQAAVRVVRR